MRSDAACWHHFFNRKLLPTTPSIGSFSKLPAHKVQFLIMEIFEIKHRTIYSATTFLEKCRKVPWEIWFNKFDSEEMVWEKWLTRKKILVCRTTLEPLFYTFIEKWLQIKWLIDELLYLTHPTVGLDFWGFEESSKALTK